MSPPGSGADVQAIGAAAAHVAEALVTIAAGRAFSLAAVAAAGISWSLTGAGGGCVGCISDQVTPRQPSRLIPGMVLGSGAAGAAAQP